VTAFGKVCECALGFTTRLKPRLWWTGTYRTSHVVRWFQMYLHKAGVFVQTAPYLAAAQVVHLESSGYAEALAGSASCLVFGADKVITSFDWANRRVAWVEAKQCQGKLLLNGDQFNDLMLLSGCSLLPAFPAIDEESPVARVAATRSLLSRSGQDGHAVCLQGKDEEYLNTFRKARFVIKHIASLTEDGTTKLKAADAVPNDIHEFLSQRLPDELYFYLSRGVAGPRVLNWRARMVIFETPPLDGGHSAVYRDLVQEKLRPLRAQALALITRLAHRYYQKTDVELICWFDETDKRQLGIPENPFFEDNNESPEVSKWHVKDADIQSSGVSEFASSPLLSAIRFLSDDGLAKKTVTPRRDNEDAVLRQPNELLANTTFRFMQDRGYVNNDHTLSAWGKALKASLDVAKKDGYLSSASLANEAEEALFMAFELLRLDVLNSKTMFQMPPYSGQPFRGSETDKANTLLISRIACLGTLTHNQIGYTGPLSRHLLAYHQLTAAVRGALRDLVEMHACNLFLSGAVDRGLDNKQYTDLGANLPFVKEPDLGLSLVVKSYLDELSNEASKRTDISKWFNHAYNIEGDLQKAWKMWAAVSDGRLMAQTATDRANLSPRSTPASKRRTAASLTTRHASCSRTPTSGFTRSSQHRRRMGLCRG